jgi:hypothetical protein
MTYSRGDATDGACSTYVSEMRTKFAQENLKGREDFEEICVRNVMMCSCIVQRCNVMTCSCIVQQCNVMMCSCIV